MTARAEYSESKGQIEVGHTGRGKNRKPIYADAVSTAAVNVDCPECECTSVEGGSMVRTPPPRIVRLPVPRHLARLPSRSLT